MNTYEFNFFFNFNSGLYILEAVRRINWKESRNKCWWEETQRISKNITRRAIFLSKIFLNQLNSINPLIIKIIFRSTQIDYLHICTVWTLWREILLTINQREIQLSVHLIFQKNLLVNCICMVNKIPFTNYYWA